MKITWKDPPPPPKVGPSIAAFRREFLAELRKHPNRWALYNAYANGGAASNAVKSGRAKHREYEWRQSKSEVFVRFVGKVGAS